MPHDFQPPSDPPVRSTECSAARVEQLIAALDGLVQECEYSASSGLPFNFPDGQGHWTQLGNAKALLAELRQNAAGER